MPTTTRSQARQARGDTVEAEPSAPMTPDGHDVTSKRPRKRAKLNAATPPTPGVRPLFAFLRGVNIGGRTHSMASIARALTAAGFADVSTFLASGNVSFTPTTDDDGVSLADVEARVERVLASLFGTSIPVIVRSSADLARIVGAITEPATATNVVLLKQPLTADQRAALAALSSPADVLQPLEKEFVWYSSTQMSASPLFKLSFEKRLGASAATVRTANTLRRLLQRAGVTR